MTRTNETLARMSYRLEQALAALGESIVYSYADPEMINRDEDLDYLRDRFDFTEDMIRSTKLAIQRAAARRQMDLENALL